VSPELAAVLAKPAQEAAVLLGLVDRPAGWTVLLTERARHLTHHPGQVGLPGGRLLGSAEAVTDAALREAGEEVGLAPADVEVAGCLRPYLTGTGFRVTPVVGFVADRFRPRPDAREVAAVFEVPLARMLAPGAFAETRRERLGTWVRSYELHFDGHRVWGATAAMLIMFIELVFNDRS
jgi:8-oxo-dGTP pyrophosphatase MutT (NUDIX family)